MKIWDLDSLMKKESDGRALFDCYDALSIAEIADRLSSSMPEQEVIDTMIYLFRRLAEALPKKKKEHDT